MKPGIGLPSIRVSSPREALVSLYAEVRSDTANPEETWLTQDYENFYSYHTTRHNLKVHVPRSI